MMISYNHESIEYHTTTGGIIIQNGKVLLQREQNQPYWFLPGGSVEADDTPEYTIAKMIYEQLGVPVIQEQQVWMIENIVDLPLGHNMRVHETGMFFVLELPYPHPIFNQDGEFTGTNKEYRYKWIDLDVLRQHHVVPEFVVPELHVLEIGKGVKYIVS
ncbi:NUDIX domain-containing protein [Paenibacillus sp. An7]|uniref:NUDIX domain-containing protein n=1 Tax=Paenibacillus sp. An7 TaxID=2689577 RepID=UPI00135CBDF8|nr:NUDIX domain-containing protein [Paenibacillus sp. An7]